MASIPLVIATGNIEFHPLDRNMLLDPFNGNPSMILDQTFPLFNDGVNRVANIRVDWLENSKTHVFKADVPGMKKEHLKVKVLRDEILSISGERLKEDVDETNTYRQEECSYGKFCREFKLPSLLNLSSISAKVHNGVLTVTIEKTEGPSIHQFRNLRIHD